MKRKLLTTLLMGGLMSFTAAAQVIIPDDIRSQFQMDKAPQLEAEHNFTGVPPLQDRNFKPAELAGITTYDLQTNGAVQRRVTNNNGLVSTVFTMGFDAAASYPNRGTGYNSNAGGSFGPTPNTRIESVRTGWPSIDLLADGTEIIVAHAGTNELILSKRNGTAWDESMVPTDAAPGLLWPRMAVAGNDGNTVHLLAITTPEANDGTIYEGMDGHILYFRSLDGGDTWDITDAIIPGIDSSRYASGDADSYFIDARGETVAVGVFSDFGDVVVSKSTDNGTTWNTTILNDFPLDKYVTDAGYSFADVAAVYRPEAPDSLAIFTSDGTGTVLIDNNDQVHVWFGEMFVADLDTTDEGTSYYPAISGMSYWNEGADSLATVFDVVDANNNDSLDIASIDDIAKYFASLTAFPSAGIDENNNIFVAYSGLTENYANENANPNPQNYRHIYVTFTGDDGATWHEPVDLINPEVLEADIYQFFEGVFPSVARVVDQKVHVVFQADNDPGLSVRGPDEELDQPTDNFIYYVALDISNFGFPSSTEELTREINLEVAPNPATDRVALNYEVTSKDPVQLNIFSATGKLVEQRDLGTKVTGTHSHPIDVSTLPNGLYFLNLSIGQKTSTQRVVVQH